MKRFDNNGCSFCKMFVPEQFQRIHRCPNTIPMERIHVRAAIHRVLAALDLGEGSVEITSAYRDYVVLRFALIVREGQARTVEKIFRDLCNAHGWTECRVRACSKSNDICVTLHESTMVESQDVRMA